MAQFRPIDLRLLGALGARGGRARPGELGKLVGLPARSMTRALGRLDDAGMLAQRSKAHVTLSAAAWLLLTPNPPTSRPMIGGDEQPLEHEELDVDELEEDALEEHDEQLREREAHDVEEQLEERASEEGGFMRGFIEGL